MFPITIACLIWLPALIGLGSPLASALRRDGGTRVGSFSLHAAIAGLLGMFTASVVATAASFWLPIYPLVSTAVLLSGWIMMIRHRRRWMRVPKRAWRVFFTVLFVIVLIDARGLPWSDTGYYHLQSVRWLTRGPTPAGLANLFGPLGYNCSWFPFAAATETPLALGKSCFIVNTLLALLIALPAVDSALRLPRGPIRPDRLLLVLLLIPLAHWDLDVGMVSSLAPDPCVMLLVLFSIALFARSPRFAPTILTLACFAVTIKLSAAPLLVIALLMIRGRIWRWGIAPAAFCTIAAVISLAHGIWLSGYPAFPSSIGRIPNLDWTVPNDLLTRTAVDIRDFSKFEQPYNPAASSMPWIAGWLHRVWAGKSLVYVYCVFFSGIVLWLWRRPRFTPARRRCLFAMVLLIPVVPFWFFTAPQVRFGYGYLFGIASLALAIGLGGAVIAMNHRFWRSAVFAAMFGLLLIARVDRKILKTALLRWPEIPVVQLTAHRTLDGVTVWMPAVGGSAWDAQPATPRLPPHLRCELDARERIRKFYIDH